MLHRQLRPWRLLVPIRALRWPQISLRTIHASYSLLRPQLPSVSQASIVFTSAHHATPSNLIASVEPIHLSQEPDQLNNGFDQAILLFTPSFAHSLAYDPKFLHDILNRLYQDLPIQHKSDASKVVDVNVAVAVVDRLPLPSSNKQNLPPIRDHGFEGMSYVVSTRQELRVATVESEREDSSRDQTKTLTASIGDEEGGVLNVRIPLASTIFQAGHSSMLSMSSWKLDKKANSVGSVMEQKEFTSPSHLSFEYPFAGKVKIKIPLLPLTPPRKILAGMGNVIRQIEGVEKVMTASQELEPAVSAYFAKRGLPPSAVSVWALVTPSEVYDKAVWQRNPLLKIRRWETPLVRGARLHRVLSGGGGWGKKAGLISLDPDSDFKVAPSADMGAIFANSDLFEAQEGMLGNAAKVGDFVQFFIAYIAPRNNLPFLPGETPTESEFGLDIGVIPSTVDAMPIMDSPHDDDVASQRGVTFLNQFGFMSEKGVSIGTPRNKDEPEAVEQPEWRTKLTTPFSRLKWGRKPNSNDGLSSLPSKDDTATARSHETKAGKRQRLLERQAQQLLEKRREARFRKLQRTLALPGDYTLDPKGPILRKMATHEKPEWDVVRKHHEKFKTARELDAKRLSRGAERPAEKLIRKVQIDGTPNSSVGMTNKGSDQTLSSINDKLRVIYDHEGESKRDFVLRRQRLQQEKMERLATGDLSPVRVVESSGAFEDRVSGEEQNHAQFRVRTYRLRKYRSRKSTLPQRPFYRKILHEYRIVPITNWRFENERPLRKVRVRTPDEDKTSKQNRLGRMREDQPLRMHRVRTKGRPIRKIRRVLVATPPSFADSRVKSVPQPLILRKHSSSPQNEAAMAAWTLLQKRRNRGDVGVKMRQKIEEKAEKIAESKAEKRKNEAKENEELLSTVRDLLKGF
jgi:hypothetical protein